MGVTGLVMVLVAFPMAALAQEPEKAAKPPYQEMRKLDFLVGEWSGEAWIQMGPEGKRETVIQTEKVQPRLGGKLLLIEGLGRERLEGGVAGKVVHDALAIVSWDPEKDHYRFIGYVADRPGVDTILEVGDNTAVWGLTTPQGGRVRYTIRLTEKGEWNEIGEFSRDGQAWKKFFEMTLRKK